MILKGTLTVKITEREGKPLKSGLLDCKLGQFQVRYAHLETLDEGQYKGFFSLVQIQQSCYSENGQYCFALEAVVDEMTFQHTPTALPQRKRKSSAVAESVETPNQMCLGIEADKVIEETEEVVAVVSEAKIDAETEVEVETENHPEASEDAALFGSLWPLSEVVQLDMTESRDRIRIQSKRLQQLSYQFDTKTQVWIKPEGEIYAA